MSMKNISSIGMTLAALCAIPASAFAGTSPAQRSDGILQQEQPDWIEALPILEKLRPTLTEAIRATNLLIHEDSTLAISSPTYKDAHRLLLQHLMMMERQLSFNPVDLARFQATTHPERFTIDSSVYPRGNVDGSAVDVSVAFFPNALVRTGNTTLYRSYAGDKPSRRTIVSNADEQNRLRVLD